MKRQKAIIKNSALPKVTKVIVGSEPNLVAENIRKGVTILGVEGTYEDGTSGGLTPFRVGQTISGVTINPTAKSVDEISNWMNTLPYEGLPLKLIGKGDGDTEMIAIMNFSDLGIEGDYPKMLNIILGDASFVLFNTQSYKMENTPVGEITVPQGWSYFGFNDDGAEGFEVTIRPITELTTYNDESPEATIFNAKIASIADGFDFLNGTAIGVIEATDAPTETLTPFTVGQRTKGVTIDPTAKTNEEIIEWLNTFSYSPEAHIELMNGGGGEYIVTVSRSTDGRKSIGFYVTHVASVCFFSEDVPEIVPEMNASKGWNYINKNDGIVEPITEKTTFNGDTYEVAEIADKFAFLNGTVLGAVEGEAPQGSHIPFRPGQAINCIEVATNAKTNDELSAFVAKALEGQGDTKTLVTDSVGNDVVAVQGDADYGYVITADSGTDNLIAWVSKGLELDGKFTFPSAGWYLINLSTNSVQEASGVTSICFGETPITIGENIDAAFNSELNGTVFGAVAA